MAAPRFLEPETRLAVLHEAVRGDGPGEGRRRPRRRGRRSHGRHKRLLRPGGAQHPRLQLDARST